jgi:hypothetical protein
MKSLCVLLLLGAGLLGCAPNMQPDCSGASHLASSVPVVKPMSNLFPIHDGTHWTFANDAGEYTWFDFSALRGTYGCSTYSGPTMMMHITKSAVGTYWNPGFDAELFQPEVDSGEEVWSPGYYYRHGSGWSTVDMSGLETQALPYPYLPDVFSKPGKIAAPYVARTAAGASVGCLPAGSNGFQNPWTTYWYAREVSTPIYSGIAVASHQCEGLHSDFEEVWLFAPGVGLVEVDALRQFGQDQNPPLVIKRQR